MKPFLATALSLLLFLCLALSGCNTIRGVGQDIQKAGSAIEGTIKK